MSGSIAMTYGPETALLDLVPSFPEEIRVLLQNPGLPERRNGRTATIDPWDLLQKAMDYAAAAEQTISEQSVRISELEAIALTDPLTGLFNRRGFHQALSSALDVSRRYGEPGVVVYLDLDQFKSVNDRFGHAVGDAMLREAGRILRLQVRASDIVARLGGDEFAVLLQRAEKREGLKRAAALRDRLRRTVLEHGTHRLHIQASIGIKAFDGEDDAEAILHQADLAMYNDKRKRRIARN